MVAEQVEFVDCCWTRLRTIQSAPLLNYRLYRKITEEQSERINPSLTSENKRPLVFPPVVAACYERVVPHWHRAVYRNVGGLRPLCVPPTEISRIGERGALRLVGSRVDDFGELHVQDMLFPRHLEQHLVIAFSVIRIRVLGEELNGSGEQDMANVAEEMGIKMPDIDRKSMVDADIEAVKQNVIMGINCTKHPGEDAWDPTITAARLFEKAEKALLRDADAYFAQRAAQEALSLLKANEQQIEQLHTLLEQEGSEDGR